jgi:hypothetical protein
MNAPNEKPANARFEHITVSPATVNIGERGAHLRRLQHAPYLGSELIDDRLRRSRGCDQRSPSVGLEVPGAGLNQGRHVLQLLEPLASPDREGANAAAADVLVRGKDVVEHGFNLAADQVLQCRRAALVGDVLDVDAMERLEELHRQLRRRSDAG